MNAFLSKEEGSWILTGNYSNLEKAIANCKAQEKSASYALFMDLKFISFKKQPRKILQMTFFRKSFEKNVKSLVEIIQKTHIARACFKKAYDAHIALGKNGLEMVQKNQFGETALKADIEAEKAVLDALRDFKL